MRSSAIALFALIVGSVATAAPEALAAPPANDDWQSPTVFAGIPFRVIQDTTEATAGITPGLSYCTSTEHSVWFRFTVSASERISVSTAGSNYDTVLSAYRAADSTAEPSSWDSLGCGPGSASGMGFPAEPGNVYYVMAASRTDVAGTLELSVRRVVTIHMTLAQRGKLTRDGTAVLHGNLSCSRSAHVKVRVELWQRARFGGETRSRINCGPSPREWRIRVDPKRKGFLPGRARLGDNWYRACEFEKAIACNTGEFTRQGVRLH
jgi:hypothetical protein